jgi:hypothetical protein
MNYRRYKVELGTLLNQNIRIEKETQEIFDTIKLINTINNMELARIDIQHADELDIWINPGGFISKKDYDKYIARKELHKINIEMIQEEFKNEK